MKVKVIWTPEIKARFALLCSQGKSRDDIAEALGWPAKKVSCLNQFLRAKGEHPSRLLSRPPHPLTGREDELRQMSLKGMSARAIAKKLGLSFGTVTGIMYRHGLYAKKQPRNKPSRKRVAIPEIRSLTPSVFSSAELRAGREIARAFEVSL